MQRINPVEDFIKVRSTDHNSCISFPRIEKGFFQKEGTTILFNKNLFPILPNSFS